MIIRNNKPQTLFSQKLVCHDLCEFLRRSPRRTEDNRQTGYSPLPVRCRTGEFMKENEIRNMLATFRFGRNRFDRAIESLEDILTYDMNED